MDRNTVIGSVLIGLLIIGYFFVTKPSDDEIRRSQFVADSIAQVEYAKNLAKNQKATQKVEVKEDTSLNNVSDSLQQIALSSKYGRYASAAQGTIEYSTIKNNLITVTFSNKGAHPVDILLANYSTYYKKPLHLLSKDSTKFGMLLSDIGTSTANLFFTKEKQATNDSAQTISYRLHASPNSYIEYVYSLKKDSYKVDLKINMVGMESYIKESRYILEWESPVYSTEKSKKIEGDNSTIVWKYFEDDVENLNPLSDEKEKEELSGKVKWIGFKQHFFTSAIIANESFERGGFVASSNSTEADSSFKHFSSNFYMANNPSNSISFYFGPNHYLTLKDQGAELEGLLDLGWFAVITTYAIIPIFNWLSGFLTNFGLIILLLTIILKLVLFPLTFKSYLSTARMRVLKPQIDEINKKFPNSGDAMKRQQANMELYRKAGVNPMGGCIPLLIQFPILIAMFRFFPASIELRQQSFLWAEDLSSYDSIMSLPFNIPFYGEHVSLFTLLMAVSMIFINQINMQNTVSTPGMPNMKVMMWIMSVMMIFWFNSYSSGLSYYYFLANVITLIQTFIIRSMVDDSKILAKIEHNRKTPKKKSRFQERLEQMAREQQKMRKK